MAGAAVSSRGSSMNAVSALLDEKIINFYNSFIASSRKLFFHPDGKPIHNGEFGGYREEVVRALVSQFAPERMAVDHGFVVTSSGRVSTQCDIVVYDRTATPMIRNANNQRFFPVESVCAVGEVKSVLGLADAKLALNKLAAIKSLRDSLHEPAYVYCAKGEGAGAGFRPEVDERDQLVTFLICEKLDFNVQKNLRELVDCYLEDLPHWPFCNRHNMVLSVKDGLLTYLHDSGCTYPFPSKLAHVTDVEEPARSDERPVLLKHRWIQPSEGSIEHIRHFCSMLHTALTVVSVLFPDLARYVQGGEDVMFVDMEQVWR